MHINLLKKKKRSLRFQNTWQELEATCSGQFSEKGTLNFVYYFHSFSFNYYILRFKQNYLFTNFKRRDKSKQDTYRDVNSTFRPHRQNIHDFRGGWIVQSTPSVFCLLQSFLPSLVRILFQDKWAYIDAHGLLSCMERCDFGNQCNWTATLIGCTLVFSNLRNWTFMHYALQLTLFFQIEIYQSVIKQGGNPVSLVSVVTLLCTRTSLTGARMISALNLGLFHTKKSIFRATSNCIVILKSSKLKRRGKIRTSKKSKFSEQDQRTQFRRTYALRLWTRPLACGITHQRSVFAILLCQHISIVAEQVQLRPNTERFVRDGRAWIEETIVWI